MPCAPSKPHLLSLAPDTMDALRFARWHGWLPDIDRLEEDLHALGRDRGGVRRLAAAAPWGDVLAARLSEADSAALRHRYGTALQMEPDVVYSYQAGAMGRHLMPEPAPDHTASPPAPPAATLHFHLTDIEGAPLAGVRLRAEGTGLDDTRLVRTDDTGTAVIALATENPAAVRRLTVLPPPGFWGRRMVRPVLHQTPHGAPARPNTIILRTLDAPFGNLPDPAGIAAMGLDRAPLLTLPGTRPVSVAVLDPGAAVAPFTIETVESGPLVEGWSRAGAPPSPAATVIDAAAPGARLHILRMGPKPHASDLIAAINWCLAAGVDLLDLGFAAATACEALRATLARARAQGLVVIAAAGDSAGPVLYPAAEAETLAVGAFAAPGLCPPDAPGAGTGTWTLAAFSARGAALDLAAPGTGMVAATPRGYEALEGTALAVAHVTGFLARLLQTEPGLGAAPRSRGRATAMRAALWSRCCTPDRQSAAAGPLLPIWDPLAGPQLNRDPCPVPGEYPRLVHVTPADAAA